MNLRLVISLALLYVLGVGAQEETQCRGHDVNLTTEQRKQITDCLAESGISTIWKIPAEKLACFGVCILEKKKLMTDDGKLNKPKILDYIDMIMRPEEVKQPLKEGITKCMEDHGDKVRGNDDPTCMTFMEVGQCVHDVFLDICIED
ncbi:unnamed protein product [Allacma fusca]|uniref:Uncharacterized protein n=1 Tax=Allacma fusca TaxID=39272 RepID=A0A8J2PNI1_9HEXA|nr:unnamed protein product [Allacma fusca]